MVRRYYSFFYNTVNPKPILGDGHGVPQATEFVLAADYDRLATLARSLAEYSLKADIDSFYRRRDLAQAILKELGEVPCPPKGES